MRARSGVFGGNKQKEEPRNDKPIECFISHGGMEEPTQPVIAPPISSLSEPGGKRRSRPGLERTISHGHHHLLPTRREHMHSSFNS